jgi:hypothetical protein
LARFAPTLPKSSSKLPKPPLPEFFCARASSNHSEREFSRVHLTGGIQYGVGGGNGILLSEILKVHPNQRGVLADLPHVLDWARERGFLGGGLAARASFADCDFLREVPQGCRAYMMKSVIHDWNNEDAYGILVNRREATPNNGALLLMEGDLPEENAPSRGKSADLVMMVLAGGKERTIEEYRTLLRGAGFALNKVTPTGAELNLIEALPV